MIQLASLVLTAADTDRSVSLVVSRSDVFGNMRSNIELTVFYLV